MSAFPDIKVQLPARKKKPERAGPPGRPERCSCHWADFGPPSGWRIKSFDLGCDVPGHARRAMGL